MFFFFIYLFICFFLLCTCFLFCFWLTIRDKFHNLRLDLWWKNVSINKRLWGQGHTGPCSAEHPESVCGFWDRQNMLRRPPVHKVTDWSFARQCLTAQSNLWFFSLFFFFFFQRQSQLLEKKNRHEKEWCFEDIIKDIVQRTTFCIFELLLSLKTTQNMEIWLPEAHKSMISKASEPNKYGELNTLKCKSHLQICIWMNLKEVCLLKTLWGRNGWSWRGFGGDTDRQPECFIYLFFTLSLVKLLDRSKWYQLKWADRHGCISFVDPESALSDLNN